MTTTKTNPTEELLHLEAERDKLRGAVKAQRRKHHAAAEAAAGTREAAPPAYCPR